MLSSERFILKRLQHCDHIDPVLTDIYTQILCCTLETRYNTVQRNNAACQWQQPNLNQTRGRRLEQVNYIMGMQLHIHAGIEVQLC